VTRGYEQPVRRQANSHAWRRPALAAAVYLAAMAGVIYGLLDPWIGQGSDAAWIGLLVFLGVLHLGTGYATRV